MKIIHLLFIMPFIALGCNQLHNNNKDRVLKKKVTQISENNGHTDISHEGLVNGSDGVITINESAEFKDTFFFDIYNLDSTAWEKASFSSDMIDKYHISPYAFNYDDYVMIFRCTGISNGFYKVIIDENRKIEKLIPARQKYLTFETWPQHIVKRAFSVDFIPGKNPLKSDTTNLATTLPYDKQRFYHPEEIKGYWLKVKDDNGTTGWIKWRDKEGELLIEIYYDA